MALALCWESETRPAHDAAPAHEPRPVVLLDEGTIKRQMYQVKSTLEPTRKARVKTAIVDAPLVREGIVPTVATAAEQARVSRTEERR
jgi:hypothetical protein